MNSPLYNEEKEKELQQLIEKISDKIEIDKDNPKLYYTRALQYYQLSQQYYDILEIFDRIGDKEKYFKYVNAAFNDIDKALSYNEEMEDYAYTFKLLMLKKLKRWEDAINYGAELYDGIGCTFSDFALIGEAYFNLENWEKCIECYSITLEEIDEETAKSFGDIFVERGIAYKSSNQFDLAIKDFEKHLEFHEVSMFDKYDIYSLIASTYKELNDYQKAVDFYTKSLEEFPQNSSTYFERGRIYCDVLHDYTLATKDFDNAIKYSNSEFHFLYHFCGYAYVHKAEIERRENKELAIKDFDKAIEMYKIANKLEYKNNENSEDAKMAYDSTVGYAEKGKNNLLQSILAKKRNNKMESEIIKDGGDEIATQEEHTNSKNIKEQEENTEQNCQTTQEPEQQIIQNNNNCIQKGNKLINLKEGFRRVAITLSISISVIDIILSKLFDTYKYYYSPADYFVYSWKFIDDSTNSLIIGFLYFLYVILFSGLLYGIYLLIEKIIIWIYKGFKKENK